MLTKTLKARWKALMPIVGYGVSEAVKHGTDFKTPSGIKAFVTFAVVAILVHQVPNSTAVTVTTPDPTVKPAP